MMIQTSVIHKRFYHRAIIAFKAFVLRDGVKRLSVERCERPPDE
jgi:hypothetical protein